MEYNEFLKGKIEKVKEFGFDVELSELNPMLYDFQQSIVQWGIRKGRAAIFADCLLPDSYVYCNGEYKKIQDCQCGDSIETLTGFGFIKNMFVKKYCDETRKIKSASGFEFLEVTKNHKFYVLRKKRCRHKKRENTVCSSLCNRRCSTKLYKDYKIEILRADQLTTDDFLLYRKQEYIDSFDKLMDSYLLLMGYYLSEGCLKRTNNKLYGISFSLHLKEGWIADEILKALSHFNIKGTLDYSKSKQNVLIVNFSNQELANKLYNDCGSLSHKKTIPSYVRLLSKREKIILLNALFNGDAHINLKHPSPKTKGRLTEFIKFVTTSYQMAAQTRDLLLSMGIQCSSTIENAKIDKNGQKHKKCYRVMINRRFMNEFGYDIKIKRRCLRQITHRENNQEYTLIPIRKIEKDFTNTFVYNLESNAHDSYLTDSGISKNCGLGKTPMQLEWARQVCMKTQGDALILAPLAVSKQTKQEGIKFNIEVNICREQGDVVRLNNITNYEILDHFDASQFSSVVLDESSILKSYVGKTKQALVNKFKDINYRLCCTATPSPNDHTELGNHSEFLGYLKRTEMLSNYFIHDASKTQDWRIKGHGRRLFWEWVASWAIFIRKPSDIGFNDDNFILPPLNIKEHILPVHHDQESGTLFKMNYDMSITDYNREKKNTLHDRVKKTAEIVNSTDEIYFIWCDRNFEADELRKQIPEAIEVRGSDSSDRKEQVAIDFVNGKIRVLISKPSIFGFGLNFQICHNVNYCGISYSYESFYQSSRRFWRFGQTKPVNLNIIIGESEIKVLDVIKEKERKYMEIVTSSQAYFNEVSELRNENKDRELYQPITKSGDNWKLIKGDCIEESKHIESDSIDYTIFSPPFADLYTYSDNSRDMGNSSSYDEFFDHFEFLVENLHRITKPGRLLSFHCIDIPLKKEKEGYLGLLDFPGDLIRVFKKYGWIYHSKVTIWKNPLVEATRTKALGLMHKTLCKDSSLCRQGLPDYLVTMRKHGENQERISNDPGFQRFIGSTEPTEKGLKYSHEVWRRYASPVWMDIRQSNTLNVKVARSDQDEKHICPLQLDTIGRALELWTNENDVVFSPFAGIGSEGYTALKMNRKFLGIELKQEYFEVAAKNLNDAVESKDQTTLF